MGVNPRAPHGVALRRPFSADTFLFNFSVDEAQRAPPLTRHRPVPGRETRKADAHRSGLPLSCFVLADGRFRLLPVSSISSISFAS